MTTTTSLEITADTDRLINSLGNALAIPTNDIIGRAVRAYAEQYREETLDEALDILWDLDGSAEGAVSWITGLTIDELEALGGFAGTPQTALIR